MHRSTWKSYERRVAKDLNGQRIPVTGIDRHGADVITPMFAVQVKRRQGLPGYLRDWLGGICSTANGKVGIVIWNELGKRDGEAVVVMRYCDFIDLHGKPEP
jgi:hypothetical protein